MIYNRSIERNGSLPQYKAEVTTMLKNMDFGVYGKGIDGYIHYSLAMDRIQEESRKALMDEFDNDCLLYTSLIPKVSQNALLYLGYIQRKDW